MRPGDTEPGFTPKPNDWNNRETTDMFRKSMRNESMPPLSVSRAQKETATCSEWLLFVEHRFPRTEGDGRGSGWIPEWSRGRT